MKNIKPDLSYVVPVYNKQAWISETLDALTQQTHKNIEIIVVDDCSTDESGKIIEYLAKKDKRIRHIELTKNMGRSYARNCGNRLAKSDWIAVNDADDISNQRRTEYILDYISKHPDRDVIVSAFYIINKGSEPKKVIPSYKASLTKIKKDGCTYMGHSTMAYKKDAIDKIKYSGGLWSKYGMDDWKLQIDMMIKKYKFGFISAPLVSYRDMGDESIVLTRPADEVITMKKGYLNKL